MKKHITNLQAITSPEIEKILTDHRLPRNSDDDLLGTIGSGNHFVEFMCIDHVNDRKAFEAMGIEDDTLLVCVHSGSRHLGKQIFDRYGPKMILAENANAYLREHDYAVKWGALNRCTLASRLLCETYPRIILDITHNSISQLAGTNTFVHRKGAAPTDRGPVVIPGSRGSLSYLVNPKQIDMTSCNFSIAHGAGRRLTRSKAHAKASKNTNMNLHVTELDSHVMCSDPQILAEEIPEAYKNIECVIDDLMEYIDIIAVLKPLLTVKDF